MPKDRIFGIQLMLLHACLLPAPWVLAMSQDGTQERGDHKKIQARDRGLLSLFVHERTSTEKGKIPVAREVRAGF